MRNKKNDRCCGCQLLKWIEFLTKTTYQYSMIIISITGYGYLNIITSQHLLKNHIPFEIIAIQSRLRWTKNMRLFQPVIKKDYHPFEELIIYGLFPRRLSFK